MEGNRFKRSENFRFIHFATHGYVKNENPNFSALLLDPGSKSEDGLLMLTRFICSLFRLINFFECL